MQSSAAWPCPCLMDVPQLRLYVGCAHLVDSEVPIAGALARLVYGGQWYVQREDRHGSETSMSSQ